MKHALVFASGTGIKGEDLTPFLQLKVSEVTQLKRILINAERAGIDRFTVFCQESAKLSLLKQTNDRRLHSQIEFVDENDDFKFEGEEAYILQSNLLTYSTTIRKFIELTDKLKNPSILSDENNNIYGLLKLRKTDVNKALKSLNLKELLSGKSNNSMKNIVVDEGYSMNLTPDSNSIEAARELIFSNVGKTATGWIAININGRISLPVSRLLVKTPLTPNMISVLINVIGVLSGPFYALGHPVIGAICIQIATVLDRCDGEVARVKLLETKKGQWVDTISDQFTVLSFYIGLPIGFYAQSHNPWIIGIGVMNIFFFLFFLVWSFYFLVKYTDSGSLVTYMKVDNYIDKKNTTFMRKLISFLRPLGRRNFYSLAFLVMAIIGGYPLVFFFATVAISFFFLHVLEDIIKISKIKRNKSSVYNQQ